MRIHLLLTLALLTPLAHGQKTTLPLWPGGTPETYTGAPETDITKPSDRLVAGKPLAHLTNIGTPNLAFYPAPAGNNTGVTIVVFPGGSYRILAYDLEGTEVCTWLNSIGVNCALVKYRVPIEKRYPEDTRDLEDAQQAMRLTRSHASDWHIDPHRIGALGFSAGGHLVVVLGNHADLLRPKRYRRRNRLQRPPRFHRRHLPRLPRRTARPHATLQRRRPHRKHPTHFSPPGRRRPRPRRECPRLLPGPQAAKNFRRASHLC